MSTRLSGSDSCKLVSKQIFLLGACTNALHLQPSTDSTKRNVLHRCLHVVVLLSSSVDLSDVGCWVAWHEYCVVLIQWQASLAVNELQQFVRSTSSSSSSSSSDNSCDESVADCALIICGDFNSPPHTLPYQLLSRAHIDDVILDKLRRTCPFHDQVTSKLSVCRSMSACYCCCSANVMYTDFDWLSSCKIHQQLVVTVMLSILRECVTWQVERLRVYGLIDVLPRAAFTINTHINSAYKTVMVILFRSICVFTHVSHTQRCSWVNVSRCSEHVSSTVWSAVVLSFDWHSFTWWCMSGDEELLRAAMKRLWWQDKHVDGRCQRLAVCLWFLMTLDQSC